MIVGFGRNARTIETNLTAKKSLVSENEGFHFENFLMLFSLYFVFSN